MARRILARDTIRRRTIEDMKKLEVYKKEYRDIIDVYVDAIDDYQIARRGCEGNGRQPERETAAAGTKKSGSVSAIEDLRQDILQYSDRLCLNPNTSKEQEADKKTTSTLADVLSKFDS